MAKCAKHQDMGNSKTTKGFCSRFELALHIFVRSKPSDPVRSGWTESKRRASDLHDPSLPRHAVITVALEYAFEEISVVLEKRAQSKGIRVSPPRQQMVLNL